MKKLLLILFLCATPLQAQTDLLEQALSGFGLDSSTVGYRPLSTWTTSDRSDPFRLHYFDQLLARPLKIPNFTREMLWRYNLWLEADSANFPRPTLAKIRPLSGLIMNSARNLGHDVGKYGFDYTPRITTDEPLLDAVRDLYTEAGRDMGDNIVYPLPTQDWSDIAGKFRKQIAALPADLQQSLARIVAAIREAGRWRAKSLAGIDPAQYRHIYSSTTLEESQCDAHTFDQTVYDAAVAFDGASASWGAMQLAQAVEKELPLLRRLAGDYVCDIPTPAGRIVLAGRDTDVHAAPDCALLIDFGGDDLYVGPAGASSPDLPVSVLIDVAGDDQYRCEYSDMPAQGAGVLGIGMLIDLAGDDHYMAHTFAQGCGRFGVGVLYDESGTDEYRSEGFAQGAGMYGIGVLFDRTGDDDYRTVYYAQGYGFSRGLGLLVDAAGNDRYVADDIELTHVGDETPKHNESDAQGYGAGRRGDHTDGHNMSGGLGILHDLHGDDSYSAGVFAQGSGYWYGYGVLSDEEGDDVYRGVFFNLGAAAHFAIGVLFDNKGNDRSDLVMTLGFGTAHDCSAAFYIDADGDDSYTMSEGDDRACSLGSSLNNSFSLFANIRGNDHYAPVGNALGYAMARRAGEWAQLAPTTGLFFDIGGTDEYVHAQAGEGKSWTQQNDREFGLGGYGIDIDGGLIRFERE
ncbi:MAG: hypothetical protein IH600_00230 [Bacteroidetes bacterium]|nr:hypothetical protein [Bacteroidota bacterium]